MGWDRALRTYGHHRKRRVLSTETCDIFNSGDRSGHHLFSTSSSESGLGPSDSHDSVDASNGSTGRRAKNRAILQLKTDEENKQTRNNRRKKQPPQKKELFTSDQETCFSSDCASPAPKRMTRHALQDVNGKNEKQTSRRQPARKNQPQKKQTQPTKDHSSINFSEFDDYSLVISDSPAVTRARGKKSSVDTDNAIGTSTPCNVNTARVRPSPDIQTADISFIPAFSGSVDQDGPSHSSMLSHHDCSSPAFSDPSLMLIEDDVDSRNLKRLEDSFTSMRVGGRRLRKPANPVQQLSPTHWSQSEEATGRTSVSDENGQDSLEDHLFLECKERMQKLTESLLKNVDTFGNASQSSVFDDSCSLFESSKDVDQRGSVPRIQSQGSIKNDELRNEWNSESELDSEHLDSENLSAIVEGGEEEEEEVDREESDYSEDNSDTDVEANESGSLVPNEDSPVRYMLTSVLCEDDEEDQSDNEEDSSILSDKKSVGADHVHSFAEVLTPSKVRTESGEELSPFQKVLEQCGQEEPVPFHKIIPASILKKCVKIGEGVYGEVFRAKRRGQSVALKIVPIEGDFEVNDEAQKTFPEILPEIVISNELSRLREGEENHTSNFCQVKSVSLVKGCYPSELLEQWDIYTKKKKSENDRPDMFQDDQLYIMFEFGDGGCDLDGYKLHNAAQGVSVLQQVACALAVAEQALSFEHRDLHVGNILVQPTSHTTETVLLNSEPIFIDTQGIHVSIIDFTFSRLTKDGCTVFCDISTDDSLFEGKGDYQFDIYRMMRKENKNQWAPYHPHTNVMWLHYLCDKLIHHKHFQETDRSHRESLKQLRQAYNSLLDYSSAAHFVLEGSLFS